MKVPAKVSLVSSGPDRDARLAKAFVDFESCLCDLQRMGRITLNTMTDLDDQPWSMGMGKTTAEQIGLLMFALRHLVEMIEDTKTEWYAKWRATGGDA